MCHFPGKAATEKLGLRLTANSQKLGVTLKLQFKLFSCIPVFENQSLELPQKILHTTETH
jgi:hypothetical protein